MFTTFIQKKFQEETTEVDSEYEEWAVRKAFWVSICLRGRFWYEKRRGTPPSRIRIVAFFSLSNACHADQVTMDRKASIYLVEL